LRADCPAWFSERSRHPGSSPPTTSSLISAVCPVHETERYHSPSQSWRLAEAKMGSHQLGCPTVGWPLVSDHLALVAERFLFEFPHPSGAMAPCSVVRREQVQPDRSCC
jgi:hypothetical protein